MLRFDVQVELEEAYAVCRLVGELDSFTVPQLHHALSDVPPTSALLIDLSEVPFIDSAGLRALVGRIRWARECGTDVVVCSNRAATNKALALTGFDRFVTVVPSRAEAAATLEAQARLRLRWAGLRQRTSEA